MSQDRQILCKVVFDTNILWSDSEDKINGLNSNLGESVFFIRDNNLQQNIHLAVPELLVRERIEQTLYQIQTNVSKIERGASALKDWGVTITEDQYKKDFRDGAEQKIRGVLISLGVETLPTPKIDQDKLIDRAVRKIPPFNGKQDEGLKDTIIWLSLLADAEKSSNYKYILCTKNLKQFDLEELKTEFLEYNKTGLFIVGDLKELKELIDREFNLDLKLKELNRTIGNNVKELTGDIMVEFNREILKEKVVPGYGSSQGFVYDYMQERSLEYDPTTYTTSFVSKSKDEDMIVGYNFVGLNIEDINSLQEGNYEITAQLKVKPRYKEKERGRLTRGMMMDYTTTVEFASQPAHLYANESYLIIFNYNIDSQRIYLQAVERSLVRSL